jgi:phosphotransacetylase
MPFENQSPEAPMPKNITSPRSISSDELANALGEDPRRVHAAVALMRTGRADLINAVVDGRLNVDAALRMARAAKAKI